eukprot:2178749-Pleurochrysis_carterae.AAC.7
MLAQRGRLPWFSWLTRSEATDISAALRARRLPTIMTSATRVPDESIYTCRGFPGVLVTVWIHSAYDEPLRADADDARRDSRRTRSEPVVCCVCSHRTIRAGWLAS